MMYMLYVIRSEYFAYIFFILPDVNTDKPVSYQQHWCIETNRKLNILCLEFPHIRKETVTCKTFT